MEINDTALRARLDHIEQQLGELFPNAYVSYATAVGEGMPAEVIELVRKGEKMAAIKRYRELTGAGLREASDAIGSL